MDSYYVLCLLSVIVGGALGGFLNSKHESRMLSSTSDSFSVYSSILQGIAGSIIGIGILIISGVFEFSLPEISQAPAPKGIMISSELLSFLASDKETNAIGLFSAIQNYNEMINNSASGLGLNIGFKLATYSLLGGYGGDKIMSTAYDSVFGEKLKEQETTIKEQKKKQEQKNREFSMRIDHDKIRVNMKAGYFNQALELIEKWIVEVPNYLNNYGIKANILRQQGKYLDAVSCVNKGLKTADVSDEKIVAHMNFNLAIYHYLSLSNNQDGVSVKGMIIESLDKAYRLKELEERIDNSVNYIAEKQHNKGGEQAKEIPATVDTDIIAMGVEPWFEEWYKTAKIKLT
jgi:tetratricopeptide (TPR) repeat protein